MKTQIAIPSYRRATTLATHTLDLLQQHNTPPENITIFTHQHDPQHGAYQDLAQACGINHITTPATNISEQREQIFHHYPAGAHITMMDDDLTNIIHKTGIKTLEPLPGIPQWLDNMFTQTQQAGLHIWGVAPVPNPRFLTQNTTQQGLRFAIYTLIGIINRPAHPTQGPYGIQTKEDYELSLRAYWYDGGILSNREVAPQADHYKQPGGCVDTRTAEVETHSTQTLLNRWGNLIHLNTQRKSPYPEIVINNRQRGQQRPPNHPLPNGETP